MSDFAGWTGALDRVNGGGDGPVVDPTSQAFNDLSRKHGMEVVGPPLAP